MPVPVSVSNPNGKGTKVSLHQSLPSSGGLFANLGVHSVQEGLAGQQAAQARLASQAGRPANPRAGDGSKVSMSCEHSVVCDGLEFRYIGEDGLPLPGAYRVYRSPNVGALRHMQPIMLLRVSSSVRACRRWLHCTLDLLSLAESCPWRPLGAWGHRHVHASQRTIVEPHAGLKHASRNTKSTTHANRAAAVCSRLAVHLALCECALGQGSQQPLPEACSGHGTA
jgi:hypothetical protein